MSVAVVLLLLFGVGCGEAALLLYATGDVVLGLNCFVALFSAFMIWLWES